MNKQTVAKLLKILDEEKLELSHQLERIEASIILLDGLLERKTKEQTRKARIKKKKKSGNGRRKARKGPGVAADKIYAGIEQECDRCHVVKPLAEFQVSGRGRSKSCKSCDNITQAAQRAVDGP